MNGIERNRHYNTFGPIAEISGITLVVVGIIMLFYSIYGIFPVLLGAFIGFSSFCTLIDYKRKRVKFSICLFRVISLGKWIHVESNMMIGVEKSKRSWRSYSRGNRTLDIHQTDYVVYLYKGNSRKVMPLATFKAFNPAENKLAEIHRVGLIPND